MRLFQKNVKLFVLLACLVLLCIETILPPTLFTFRVWEAVKAKSVFLIGPFYPNVAYKMIEEGELAHHTPYAIEKRVVWRTDALGFRNDVYNDKPDVVVIGDSNIVGSSLSQEETLTSVLAQYSDLSVYNVAPADINMFVQLYNEEMMHVPAVMVLSTTERRVLTLPPVRPNVRMFAPRVRSNEVAKWLIVGLDKWFRANSLNYLKARANRAEGVGFQSPVEARMFFFEANRHIVPATDVEIAQVAEVIVAYRDYCAAIGCELIFLPVPNKQTIFWEMAALETQPTLLNALHGVLTEKGVMAVDTFTLFNDLKAEGVLPYHYDDSHWNGMGVDVVAQEIVRLLAECDCVPDK